MDTAGAAEVFPVPVLSAPDPALDLPDGVVVRSWTDCRFPVECRRPLNNRPNHLPLAGDLGDPVPLLPLPCVGEHVLPIGLPFASKLSRRTTVMPSGVEDPLDSRYARCGIDGDTFPDD